MCVYTIYGSKFPRLVCTLATDLARCTRDFNTLQLAFPFSKAQTPPSMQISAMPFTEEVLRAQYTLDPICHTFAYKKVANRVKPVATTMPQHAHIIRCFPEDPLFTLPPLSSHPLNFTSGQRLTMDRITELGVLDNPFLWPEERKLAAH